MRRFVERYGPASPTGRAIAATVSGAIGGFALLMVLISLVTWEFGFAEPVTMPLTLAVGILATAIAYWNAVSVVRRAEEAPEPDWWGADASAGADLQSAADEDPIDLLQRRYAEGELTTEEFEERIDRLVEQDVVSRDRAERVSGDLDREIERA